MAVAVFESPVGQLSISEENGLITGLSWGGSVVGSAKVLDAAVAQLAAYFEGDLQEFDLPLSVKGSDFQRAVCDEMRKIPFGETATYGELAKALGVPAQAVGGACGGNPIAIIIPCHRVMGAGGKLTGFSGQGGVETKIALLRHEGAGGFLI